MSQINEQRYFGNLGTLFHYDFRFNPADRAYLNPRADGRVQFRVQSEPVFSEIVLVYNDGQVRAAPLQLSAQGNRFQYWQVTIRPGRTSFSYSFALRNEQGQASYWGRHGLTHVVETPFFFDGAGVKPVETPPWMHGAVMYQIFPERFANGERGNDPAGSVRWGSSPKPFEFQGGDLQGITQNLDYLVDLGIDVIYLNPVNVSPSNHKYDAIDYYHVDAGLGGDEALKGLVDGAHARGVKVIVDASFNHCYPQFFAFKDLIENGEASRYRDWFTVYDWPIEVRYRPHLAEGRGDYFQRYISEFARLSGVPVLALDDSDGPVVEASYNAWYGVISMPQLNQDNPETRAYFMDVAKHWLTAFDLDGWRMDVVQFVADDFWIDFRDVTKSVKPDCYLLAEVWGDSSDWLQGDKFDATMNYLFRDLVLGYFAYREVTTAQFLDGVMRMLHLYAPQVMAVTQNLFSSHDVPRFLQLAGGDKTRLRLATFFQLTLPGAASIYYGDEIGMKGGHDPDNRRAFPWHLPNDWDRALLAYFQRLTALRRQYVALREGEWRLWAQNEEAFAFERFTTQERLIVVINRGDTATALHLPIPDQRVSLIFGAAELAVSGAGIDVGAIPAGSGLIFQLRSVNS